MAVMFTSPWPGGRLSVLATVAVCLVACAESSEVAGPHGSASSGNDGFGTLSEDGGAKADGKVADGAVGQDGSQGSVGLDGVTDPSDDPDAAQAKDGGTAPVGTADAAGADGSSGAADMSAATPACQTSLSQFDVLKAKALSCDTLFQCTRLGPEGLGCPCERYYSIKTFDYQNLKDVSVVAAKKGCKGSCLPEPCAPKAPQIGVCEAGSCIDYEPTCGELDSMATLALTEGLKCTSDAQCVFGANVDLKCGCSQYLNMETVGPGKPLFWYMMMLVEAYNALGCGAGVECACLQPVKATCKCGNCVTSFQEAP